MAEAVTLADRVLMVEAGEIALDQGIDLPRPRQRGSPEVAALEGKDFARAVSKRGCLSGVRGTYIERQAKALDCSLGRYRSRTRRKIRSVQSNARAL